MFMYNIKALRSRLSNLETNNIDIMTNEYIKCMDVLQCVYQVLVVATPLWSKCEDETRAPKSGNLESSKTPKNLELDFRGQNTSPWGVFYTVGKVLNSRCRKWPRMNHLDICNTSYDRKKGRESNWQFDSRPLKVGNRLDAGVCRWSVTHRWKDLEESYKFDLNLIPIGGLS